MSTSYTTGRHIAYSSAGTTTPEPEFINGNAPVHPTAARTPHPITVDSERTVYTDEHITSKFDYRGAEVVRTPEGQIKVTPTSKPYEFQTARKVQKTGYVHSRFLLIHIAYYPMFQSHDGRSRR